MKKKLLVVIALVLVLMTGCTKTMVGEDKKRIENPTTGQALTSNIICKPETESLLNKYSENEKYMQVKLEELPKCSEMKIYEGKSYNGLWVALFVRPVAWLVIHIGKVIGNYGISVMLVGLAIRLILLPFTLKTTKQQQEMQKLQPEMQKIEKKYAGRTDQDSMMQKSQETMALYQKYKVNPLSSCLITFIQMPLFFAFLEAINRVPAIFENDLWVFQLGTTPMYGIQHGNYWYIALVVLILLCTFLTFKNSISSMNGNTDQQKQSKYIMIFMVVFIGIASIQLPSAIALYWIVTNAFSVVQTFIMKKVGNK